MISSMTILRSAAYLVQSLIEFRQLSSLTHHILVHHEWSLDLLVGLFT
jgi:hypothetical protein